MFFVSVFFQKSIRLDSGGLFFIEKQYLIIRITRCMMMILRTEREPEPSNFGHLHQNYYLTG